MPQRHCLLQLVLAAMLACSAASAQIQNATEDFAAWSLSAEPGTRGKDNTLQVAGDGNSNNYWLSPTMNFSPDAVYKLSVSARSPSGGTGLGIIGPVFANLDLIGVGTEWTPFDFIFATPSTDSAKDHHALRLGQWHFNGTLQFKDLNLVPVVPIYEQQQGMTLGDGERISINEYVFTPSFGGISRNHARTLFKSNVYFNSNRLVFWQNSQLIYRLDVNGRQQLRAQAEITMHYHKSGKLAVDASKDGINWTPVTETAKVGTVSAKLPESLFPANVIFLRLSAQSTYNADAKNSDPGTFQVRHIAYRASLSGTPTEISGSTRYIELVKQDPHLKITFHSIGDALPGGRNHIVMEVTNTSGDDVALQPAVTATCALTTGVTTKADAMTLKPGLTARLSLPYTLTDTGNWRLEAALGGQSDALFAVNCPVSDFFSTAYGEIVAPDDGTATVWTASSAWKIPKLRALPKAAASTVRLSAARNEAEAAQIVVTPTRPLKNLQATVSPFTSENGSALPSSIAEILRVYYHDVQLRTDSTGILGFWPDALPPLRKGLEFPAGVNQPLWFRVTVPKNAKAGIYKAHVTLQDDGGWHKVIPVQLTVFPFQLPDAMTCQSGFGLYTDMLWKYHKPKTAEQRQAILDSYLEALAKHHISPYNPAPLTPWKASLKTERIFWKNGTPVPGQPDAPNVAREITDDSETARASIDLGHLVPFTPGDHTLEFKYKTRENGQKISITVLSHDANRKWLSGKNKDFNLTGDGSWQTASLKLTQFNPNTRFIDIRLRPTLWTEKGELKGSALFAQLKLTENATGRVIIAEDDFRPVAPKDYSIHFDWTEWDKAMEKAFNHYHFTSWRMSVAGLGGGTFASRQQPELFGFKEGSPEYEALLPKYFNAIQEHLAEKGWLDKPYIYWFDEPDPKDYDFVMNGFNKIKKHAPGLRRLLTEQVEPELIGGPNVWCPVSNNAKQKDVADRQALGEQFWWYVCTGPKAPYATLFIDHPGIELRVWLWQTWAWNIQGILVWCANLWTSNAAYPDSLQNPYLDPMGWVMGYSLPKGTKQPWGNGDGRFLYPPEAAADGTQENTVLDKPVDSIRLEMLRDGLEDYEYFVILKQLVNDRGHALAPAQKAELEALLQVPENVSKSPTAFSVNPANLEAHREKLAKAISTLTTE